MWEELVDLERQSYLSLSSYAYANISAYQEARSQGSFSLIIVPYFFSY